MSGEREAEIRRRMAEKHQRWDELVKEVSAALKAEDWRKADRLPGTMNWVAQAHKDLERGLGK